MKEMSKVLVRFDSARAITYGVAICALSILAGLSLWLRYAAGAPDFDVVIGTVAVIGFFLLGARILWAVGIDHSAAVWIEGDRLKTWLWSVDLRQVDDVKSEFWRLGVRRTPVLRFELKNGGRKSLSMTLLSEVATRDLDQTRRSLRTS